MAEQKSIMLRYVKQGAGSGQNMNVPLPPAKDDDPNSGENGASANAAKEIPLEKKNNQMLDINDLYFKSFENNDPDKYEKLGAETLEKLPLLEAMLKKQARDPEGLKAWAIHHSLNSIKYRCVYVVQKFGSQNPIIRIAAYKWDGKKWGSERCPPIMLVNDFQKLIGKAKEKKMI